MKLLHFSYQQILRAAIIVAFLLSFENSIASDFQDIYSKADKAKGSKTLSEVLSDSAWEYKSNNPTLAEELALKALTFAEQQEILIDKSKALNTLGGIFFLRGVYQKSLEYYLQALRINQAINNSDGIARNMGNIANIYNRLGDYERALEYNINSLEINKQTNNEELIANNYGNIGNIFANLGRFENALEYHKKSCELNNKIGDQDGVARNYSNIGVVFLTLKQNDSALVYFVKSLEIYKILNDQTSLSLTKANISHTYLAMKNTPMAVEYAHKALFYARSLDNYYVIQNAYQSLYESYIRTNNLDSAIFYMRNYYIIGDSLHNAEKSKGLAQLEVEHEYEKKIEMQKMETEQNELVNSLIRNFLIFALLMTIIGLILIFRGYRDKKKINSELENTNAIIEEKNKNITEQNKSITDSINYAKHLQDAVLPTSEKLNNAFREHFIVFHPRDIVSGDFYWLQEVKQYTMICVGDCTGHGVPGAFMSILCASALNEAVFQKGAECPSTVLKEADTYIVNSLKQGENNNKDGMDACVCSINKATNDVECAGASNSIYIVSHELPTIESDFPERIISQQLDGNKYFTEIKPDRFPLGGFARIKEKKFISHKIKNAKGYSFYLSTDGYADQIGGNEGKKFMTKNLKQMLAENCESDFENQADKIEFQLSNWMAGKYEQRDDILIMGFRV